MNKKKIIKIFTKDTVFYGFGLSLNNAILIIIFPFIARHFTVSDIAIIDFFLIFLSLTTVVVTFGLDSSLGRFYFEAKRISEKKEIVSESLIYQISLIIICIILFFIFTNFLQSKIDIIEYNLLIYYLILVQFPFIIILDFCLNLFKWKQERNNFLFISLGSSISYSFCILFGIYIFEISLINFFTISIIVKLIWSTLGCVLIVKDLTINISFRNFKQILIFAYPLGIIGLLETLYPFLQRIIISEYQGLVSLGYFAIASKIALIFLIISQSFQMSWGPLMLSNYKKNNFNFIAQFTVKIFLIVNSIFLIVLFYLSEYIVLFFGGQKFSNSSALIFPLCFAIFLNSLSQITELGITISKKSIYTLINYLIFFFFGAFFITIFSLNFSLFIISCGILISYFLKFLTISYTANKLYLIKWPYRIIFVIILFNLSYGVINFLLSLYNFDFFSNLFFFMSLLILIFYSWFHILSNDEKKIIKDFIK